MWCVEACICVCCELKRAVGIRWMSVFIWLKADKRVNTNQFSTHSHDAQCNRFFFPVIYSSEKKKNSFVFISFAFALYICSWCKGEFIQLANSFNIDAFEIEWEMHVISGNHIVFIYIRKTNWKHAVLLVSQGKNWLIILVLMDGWWYIFLSMCVSLFCYGHPAQWRCSIAQQIDAFHISMSYLSTCIQDLWMRLHHSLHLLFIHSQFYIHICV